MTALRFGLVSESVREGRAWLDFAREVEDSGIDPELVWPMPTVFIGSADQIRADLHARRARFGLSYLVVAEDRQAALAEVISGL
jgi:hypothetical protein